MDQNIFMNDVTSLASSMTFDASSNLTVNNLSGSTAFKTTSNLGIAGTVSSGYLDARKYTQVQTHILSDQSGTITVYFAGDSLGVDVVRTLVIPYVGGSGFQLFSAPCFSDYIKYDYLNGGVIQTDFLYETKFLTTALSPQLLGVESFISPSMVSVLNRSVIVAKDISDNYTNVRSDFNGNLRVAQKTNEWVELAIDEILDTYGDTVILKPKTLFKYGKNIDLDASVPETIWTVGGDETLLTGNTIDTIVSTDAADVYEVLIEGHTLAAGVFTFVVQSVTLTGQTDVALTTPLARCSRISNNNGTDLVGTVTVFDTTGTSSSGVVTPATAIHNEIEIGHQQSQKCQTTFSNTDYGIITAVNGGASAKLTALVEFDLQIKEVNKVWKTKYQWGTSGGSVNTPFSPYLIVPKNSDIRIRATSNTNNTEAFASFNVVFGAVQ